jgi:uncharacterized protein YgiM (DUF1202 family)
MKKIIAACIFLTQFLFASGQTKEQYLVVAQKLELRNGPGSENSVVSVLKLGEKLTLIEKYQNGWWLVDYNGNRGYILSVNVQAEAGSSWEPLEYQSGDALECENISPSFDLKLDNYLKIHVGANTDSAIKLMKIDGQSEACIRTVYIKSNESYEMKNIPAGKYYLKIAYGKDYRKKIVNNQCYQKFMVNAMYEKGKDILDFNLIKEKNGLSVPSYELFLSVTGGDNRNTLDSENISEQEFNR